MSEQEQNKRINEHNRRITRLEEEVKTLKRDAEPQGWISNAFDAVEEDLDEIKTSIKKLEQQVNHNHNQLSAKLEIILEHITGIGDLPET
jgi:archaellum component FlaC